MTCDRCGSDDLASYGVTDVWIFTCNNCGAVVELTDDQLEKTHELA